MTSGLAQRAAGAIVWRSSSGARADAGVGAGVGAGVEVLLVHRPRYDDWSLPKGKLEPGESWRDAARREVAEETGIVGELGGELAAVAYTVAAGPKLVRHWSVEVPAGAGPGADGVAFEPNDEVDEVRWFTVEEARAALTWPTDAVVLASLATGLDRWSDR